ncbi:hypothetical protein IWW56_005946, partial [Coemansia sp. RSA 2131]
SALCAVDILSRYPQLKQRTFIYTYGMPRVGNDVWANMVEKMGVPAYRVVYESDLVPHIPFQWLGYMHFSQEVWIHGNRTVFCGKGQESQQCSGSVAIGDYNIPDHSQYSLANWMFTR